MYNVRFVLLGWLAGIFSSLILEWNRDSRVTKSLRKALQFELVEFRFRMVGVAFMLATRAGTLSPGRVAWLIAEFETYKGFGVAASTDVLDALKTMQEHPKGGKVMAARFAAKLQQAAPGLKKYPTPALDAAVASVALFSPEEQRLILELRTLVSNLESATDESWHFFEKTFDSALSGEDRRRLEVNLATANAQAAELCERIAKHIANMRTAA
jgi:hypothetical protein